MRWQNFSSVEKLAAGALAFGGLMYGILWLMLHASAPSLRAPDAAAAAVTRPQSRLAAMLPATVPRACADALRPGAGEDAGDSGANDVRLLAARQLAVPVAGTDKSKLYDSFRDGRGGRKHQAIDIHAPRGTPVIAAGDGCVVKLFRSIPGGLTVYQFDPEGNYAYYYAHLERYADEVKEGTQVQRGDVLGYVGTSGNASANAPHLHFAIFRLGPDKRWWQGTAVNPYAVLTYSGT